jgi:predicted hydrolase (HD superfamily)
MNRGKLLELLKKYLKTENMVRYLMAMGRRLGG